ncbi:MAG: DotU family type IV/VI secretion system protein [Deltaproteobacteria bacterium]|nr:MAG: DotU family type IV/VI secretion system protein [Deltaproteobacteria bacterium]TMQ19937.1 MAG: DotU family type IV/VI secretion system protein [Deltaproteobacteria bacterium]
MPDDVRWLRIQMWKPVREVFQAADELFAEAERLRTAAEAEVAAPPGGPAAPPRKPAPPPGAPAAYQRRRRAVREAIEIELDPVLTDQLGPWQKHACVTAIVSFIDEREQVALGALADTWRVPLLQTELLEIDDGGDRCFTQLADLLARADVHELVFEIHLLCLRAGFVGRYAGRRHELDKITGSVIERLRYYLPHRTAAPGPPPPPPPSRGRVGFIGFPLRYYLAASAIALGLFAALRLVSAREVARSNLAEYCHYHDEGGAP